MPTRRQERVAKRIVREVVEALRNLKHIRLGFITVTRCEISPDLRQARVFVSVFGDDDERERTLRLLHDNAAKVRHMIARPLGIKVTPQLNFEVDESIATADRISRLIHDARQTDVNPNPLTPEEEAKRFVSVRPARERGRTDSDGMDAFEAARLDVEGELSGEEADGFDDRDWEPINLDGLPDGSEEKDGDATC